MGVKTIQPPTQDTARVAALESADREKERLLQAITSLLVLIDGQDRVTRWNGTAETTLGVPADRALGRPLADLDLRWDAGTVHRGLERCRTQACTVRLSDLLYTRPDGRSGILGLTLRPVAVDEERAPPVLILGIDITEIRDLEVQLRHAQKLEAIGRLAAGIAHEINTPIQYVGDNTRFLRESFTELLDCVQRIRDCCPQQGQSDDPRLGSRLRECLAAADLEYLQGEIPRAIDEALEGIERMRRIAGSMKEFSHPTDRMSLVDVNHMITNTITVGRNEWKYVAEVETDLDPDLCSITGVACELSQVVLNMIINAAHAIEERGSREMGTIRISTREREGTVEIRVADDGVGIPPAIRERIFDPFFTTKEVGKGTGQGLSIAHNVVVNKHGGAIHLESEAGRGTEFVIRLPVDGPDPVQEDATR